MIKNRNVILFCVLVFFFSVSYAVDENIPKEVLSSGGTEAASADFSLTGTLGQAMVGPSFSPVYILASGFWPDMRGIGQCCLDRVGDVNQSGDDEPTIGDVSTLIDAKFITGMCDGIVPCLTEADVNQSGGLNPTCDDITIGDISMLIDYLFITGPSLGLSDCL